MVVSSVVGVGRKLPEILCCWELWLLVFVCPDRDDSDVGTGDIVNFEI